MNEAYLDLDPKFLNETESYCRNQRKIGLNSNSRFSQTYNMRENKKKSSNKILPLVSIKPLAQHAPFYPN